MVAIVNRKEIAIKGPSAPTPAQMECFAGLEQTKEILQATTTPGGLLFIDYITKGGHYARKFCTPCGETETHFFKLYDFEKKEPFVFITTKK